MGVCGGVDEYREVDGVIRILPIRDSISAMRSFWVVRSAGRINEVLPGDLDREVAYDSAYASLA